jgi:hypothetical protein
MHPSLSVNPGYFIVFQISKTHRERAEQLWAHWSCCHLPRTSLDWRGSYAAFLFEARSNEQAHRIGSIRYPEEFSGDMLVTLKELWPTLMLSPDELLEPSKELAKSLNIPLPVTPFSALNQQTLEQHWKDIASLDPKAKLPDEAIPILSDLHDDALFKLALMFLKRQTAVIGLPYPPDLPTELAAVYDMLLEGHLYLRTFASALRHRTPPQDYNQFFQNLMKQEQQRFRVLVILSARSVRQP